MISPHRHLPFTRKLLICGLQILCAGGLIAASWLDARLFLSLWMGLCWLFWLTASSSRPFLVGFLTGSVALSTAFYWTPSALAKTIVLPSLSVWFLIAMMITWEAIPFGVVGLLAQRSISSRSHFWWLIPATWVAMEVFWPRIFPWSFAYSQTELLPLLQLAEWTGAPGISFLMIGVTIIPAVWQNYFTLHAPRSSSNRASLPHAAYTFSALSLLVIALLLGEMRFRYWDAHPRTGRSIEAAIVQIDPRSAGAIEAMRHAVLRERHRIDLVCWPESTLGTYCTQLDSFCDESHTLRQSVLPRVDAHPSRSLPCDLLAGGKSYEPGRGVTGPFYQTAFLIRPDEAISDRYIKRTLMPIGEYIPGQTLFPATREWVELSEPIVTGNDPRPLQLTNGARVGTLMCYEDMVATNARQTVAAGAELLICLINGSAFDNPLTLEQHMRLALLRAVENRRALARCAATGITCVIEPTGRMSARVEPQTSASLVARLPRTNQLTVYTRYGHLFPYGCLAAALYLPVASLARATRCKPWSKLNST